MLPKVLIVEDEVKIARFLELELKYEGYAVEVVHDGRSGYEKGMSEKFDIIILDLMLPEMSGIEVCRRIRKKSEIPIIMLTAKDDVSDKVMGLDTGANDYMTKPFAIEELLARIRAILKRNPFRASAQGGRVLSSGRLMLDPEAHRVTFEDEEISLTKKEFQLLEYLMNNQGIVLTREKMMNKVWGYDYMGDTNIIDV